MATGIEDLVLELAGALPDALTGAVAQVPMSLQIRAGDFLLIECRSTAWGANFADICCGLLPLKRGTVRFFGRDWSQVSDEYSAALKGRIGRVFHDGGWLSFLDMETNILLPQMHHTGRSTPALRAASAALANDFGLPGLPVGLPGKLSASDLLGAAYIRAFLGEPLLIILEDPIRTEFVDFVPALINAILSACTRGAAVLWLTPGDAVLVDRTVPATARLHLTERGLGLRALR
ncbi:MAG: ABC transporter ATP-binding protein [Alphaproteobacteria bacterium]|nr:ABC transporter ATP-binding protein [Alphaproteobacteria bacterium]